MDGFMRALVSVWTDSGFAALTWENCVMILVGLVLLYLSIAKEYEPLLLLPIAFGCISEGEDKYVIDADQCVDCGTCAAECPNDAISEE